MTASLALTACGGPDSFAKPDASHAQYESDLSDCLALARNKDSNPDHSGLPALFRARDKCMADRGYVKQEN